MRSFLVLSALLSVAMARPQLLQASPLTNLQAYATASATASSSPQQLSLLRLLPNVPLGPDGRLLDSLEVARAEQQQAPQQRGQSNQASENARNSLELASLLSATSSASASSPLVNSAPLAADGQVRDTLEVSLAKAAQAAAQRNEQLRQNGQSVQVAQSQSQQQVENGAGPLLSATRLAQTLASLSPTGASSSSSIQLLESPELSAIRAQQQQLQQNILLQNGLPLLVGSDGQIVAAPLLIL